MSTRKVIVEVDIDDDNVNEIVDLEREILAHDLCGQVARKYLDSLQDDMARQVNIRMGSKKVHIGTSHFEFDFQAKRTLDGMGKKRS